jgi:hypothetical protein
MFGIGSLISILLILLALGLLLWAVFYVLGQFPNIDPNIARLIRIVAVVIVVLIIVGILLQLAGYPIVDVGGRPYVRP